MSTGRDNGHESLSEKFGALPVILHLSHLPASARLLAAASVASSVLAASFDSESHRGTVVPLSRCLTPGRSVRFSGPRSYEACREVGAPGGSFEGA